VQNRGKLEGKGTKQTNGRQTVIEFPITDLLDGQSSYEWLLAHFHPEGLVCPHCGAAWSEAREFRWTKKSQVPDYRCGACDKTYNVYSQTVFEGRHFTPEQAVMVVRGIVKGEQAQILANEVGVCRHTIQAIRKLIQHNAEQNQPDTPLEDEATETDEMFQNAGEKRRLAR
jgi:transposase-like protein